MKKLEHNGKVAVVYSPGFGAGWSTWASNKEGMCMDADIAQAVLDGDNKKAVEIAKQKFPDEYVSGDNLSIAWVPKGEEFEIREYDGYESVIIISQNKYMRA